LGEGWGEGKKLAMQEVIAKSLFATAVFRIKILIFSRKRKNILSAASKLTRYRPALKVILYQPTASYFTMLKSFSGKKELIRLKNLYVWLATRLKTNSTGLPQIALT
jgi:hypothetical protein